MNIITVTTITTATAARIDCTNLASESGLAEFLMVPDQQLSVSVLSTLKHFADFHEPNCVFSVSKISLI